MGAKLGVGAGLRDCQVIAINNLEQSFAEARPKALIQMATGSGKTFTAITFIYRLLKFAKAKRILFLVDSKNLGEQAEQEMMAYVPNDDNRKFTKLYGVTRLKSSFIPPDNQVYISTIQRMYSIMQGRELNESAEETNPNEYRQKEPPPVSYNEKVPVEFFDFIVIDECHRSIKDASPEEIEKAVKEAHQQIIDAAVAPFNNPDLRNYIVDVRRKYDQVIDHLNIDEITNIGWVKDQQADAAATIQQFAEWIETHKDEITALQIFYSQPSGLGV